MQEGEAVPPSMKISFVVPIKPKVGVTKIETNVSFKEAHIVDDDDIEIVETRKRRVICLENGVIHSDETETKKEKKEYCIAIEKTYDWRIQKLQKLVEDGTATDEDKARLALMIKAFGEGAASDVANGSDNKVITATTADNSTVAGSSVNADYEEVPISEFGQAFLRGCGWKKEEGIGRTNKRVVPLHVSEARPKGLGLGSHLPSKPPPSKSERADKNGAESQDATLKKRSRVKIISGLYKGAYAEVCSLDEDNSSCFVELLDDRGERNGIVIRVSQFAIELRDKKSSKESKELRDQPISKPRERSSRSSKDRSPSQKDRSSSKRSSYSSKSRHSDGYR